MTGKIKIARLLSTTFIVSATACLEPYNAPDITSDTDILVVDGFVNATDGLASVKLTHTGNLDDETGFPAEKGATVTVRSETGDIITLIEGDSGRYSAEGLAIDPSLKYRLNVSTSDGGNYESDLITITETPEIDTLTWSPFHDGLNVLANTHDVTGNSRYYRWSYVETWEYHAPFLSGYKAENSTAIYRQPEEFIFECYKTGVSKDILVASTDRLAEDVVHEFPVIYIPRESSKLSVLYHIKVQQRVIEKAEYEFWRDLERVTETLGGLFDSQPYEILGNVHSLNNPDERVLGYFSGGKVTHKEMFIDYLDLPRDLQRRPFHGCVLDTICVVMSPLRRCSMDLTTIPSKTYLIGTLSESGVVWGFTASSEPCADCRMQGGSLSRPEFWP